MYGSRAAWQRRDRYRPVRRQKRIVRATPVTIDGEDPPYTPQGRLNISLQREAEFIISSWEKQGLIRKARSHCNSPIILTTQPNGKVLIEFDYHDLNQRTDTVAANNMSCAKAIARISLGKYYSTFTLFYGNWNIQLDKHSRYKTAFTFRRRQYIWTRVPDSFRNTTVIIHNTLGQILDRLPVEMRSRVTHYVDSVLVSGSTKPECRWLTRQVTGYLERAGFEIKRNTRCTCKPTVLYLGRQFFQYGIKLPERYLRQIESIPSPRNVADLRKILGLLNVAASHTPGYSKLRKNLNVLLRRDHEWTWDDREELALRNLIKRVLENRLAINGLKPGETCIVWIVLEEKDWMADIFNSEGMPYMSLGEAFTQRAGMQNTNYKSQMAMNKITRRAAEVLKNRRVVWKVISEQNMDY